MSALPRLLWVAVGIVAEPSDLELHKYSLRCVDPNGKSHQIFTSKEKLKITKSGYREIITYPVELPAAIPGLYDFKFESDGRPLDECSLEIRKKK